VVEDSIATLPVTFRPLPFSLKPLQRVDHIRVVAAVTRDVFVQVSPLVLIEPNQESLFDFVVHPVVPEEVAPVHYSVPALRYVWRLDAEVRVESSSKVPRDGDASKVYACHLLQRE